MNVSHLDMSRLRKLLYSADIGKAVGKEEKRACCVCSSSVEIDGVFLARTLVFLHREPTFPARHTFL